LITETNKNIELKLSIVIVNYKTKAFLQKCLTSIEKSEKIGIAEVIVIDNASNDGSIEMLKQEFPSVKFIINQTNVGFAKANNQGIKLAKAKYILLLNPDTIIFPKTLSKATEFLDNNQNVGVVTCYVELADGKIDPACNRGFPDPWTSFTYFVGLEKLFPKSRSFGRYHLGWLPLNTIHEIDTPSGCFYMIRKSVIDEVGLLDENYFLYYEEVDWSYRIKQKGWKIYFLPDVKIIHYKGTASGIKKTSKEVNNVSREIKKIAINSFCDSIKIFYTKHYKKKYPFIVSHVVCIGIEIKRLLSLWQLRV